MGSLFKLAKQIVGGKIGRKAAKLVHYLIIYHVGDLFPVDNVLRWGYISSGQTNENLNQIISVCTCTLPRIRMIGFYIPPDLGSVLYTYTYTCIQITIRAYCILHTTVKILFTGRAQFQVSRAVQRLSEGGEGFPW